MTEGEIEFYGLESVDSNSRSGGLGIMWKKEVILVLCSFLRNILMLGLKIK